MADVQSLDLPLSTVAVPLLASGYLGYCVAYGRARPYPDVDVIFCSLASLAIAQMSLHLAQKFADWTLPIVSDCGCPRRLDLALSGWPRWPTGS